MKNNKALPICIVGSGLSGISAAKALIENGSSVLMIDPGIDLEANVDSHVKRIKRKPAWRWTDQERDLLRSGVESSVFGVKEKCLFGSNFASRGVEGFPVEKKNAAFYMSFATSGLGNIWGAGLLPMHSKDMKDWPLTLSDLQPYYEKILQFMPLSGRRDRLEKLFPLDVRSSYHGPSRQAVSALTKMEKNADKLEQKGFFFGASRLAGRFHCRSNDFDCQYCGMCMYGCPYGIIFSSRDILDELKKNPNFEYQKGLIATNLNQSGGSVQIRVTDINGYQLAPILARRVILACGPFATAKIMLDTLNMYDTPLFIRTTDQYYLPFFSFNGQKDIYHEKLHTMCQLFWITANKKISPHLIHTSVYTYNDFYLEALKEILGPLTTPLYPLFSLLLSRLYFTITYLHSDHSSLLEVRLQKDAKRTLVVNGKSSVDSRRTYKSLRRLWARTSKYTGLIPLPLYKGDKLPGAGNHSGGCFPMKKNPEKMQTDLQGRLPGLDRVHIVDSSVFPSITATTITLTIMANAYRIASSIKNDEKNEFKAFNTASNI